MNKSILVAALAALATTVTGETDAEIAKRERTKGAQAKREGKGRDECPWHGGKCEQWWLEGYDDPWAGVVAEAQTANEQGQPGRGTE